jgi:hypothetical protein
MSSKVAKGLCVLAVVVALTAMVPVKSEAGTDLGQLCWAFGTYNEIRCSVTLLDGPETLYGLYCSDRSTRFNYQFSGAGLARQGVAGKIQMSFVGGTNSESFDGIDTCTYVAELDDALNGPAIVDCVHSGKYFPNMVYKGTCP